MPERRIGYNTARILRAMDVEVLAFDTFQNEKGKEAAGYVELDELLAASGFIFPHCTLFPETQNIINKANIAKMKDGVILIHDSREQRSTRKRQNISSSTRCGIYRTDQG